MADVSDIYDHSAQRWGHDRAGRYILTIKEACQALASGTRVSRRADEVRANYQKCRVGSHIIFFRRAPDQTIEVIRILHQRMDAARHL